VNPGVGNFQLPGPGKLGLPLTAGDRDSHTGPVVEERRRTKIVSRASVSGRCSRLVYAAVIRAADVRRASRSASSSSGNCERAEELNRAHAFRVAPARSSPRPLDNGGDDAAALGLDLCVRHVSVSSVVHTGK
jgi:hypothetical protein